MIEGGDIAQNGSGSKLMGLQPTSSMPLNGNNQLGIDNVGQ